MNYKTIYDTAYEEMRAQSADTSPDSTIVDNKSTSSGLGSGVMSGASYSGNGTAASSNPMNSRLSYTSNGTVVTPNGAVITAYKGGVGDTQTGYSNIKSALNSGAYGSGVGTALDSYGNLEINGKDTGINAADYAGDVNSRELSQAYSAATGDTPAWARQYMDTLGLGNAVTWSDGKLLIGGMEIPYQYIDDAGHAYVKQSVLEEAAQEYKNARGIDSENAVSESVRDKYADKINSALNKVTNRDEWTYDADKDAAYEAYAKMYQRNAESAYNRAMGSGGLYGRPTSYQMYQALAGYGDNMQQLSQAVPELAKADYERYSDEQSRNLAAYNALANERDTDYSMTYGANSDTLNRIAKAEEESYARDRVAQYEDPLNREAIAQARQQTEAGGYSNRIGANEAEQSDIYTQNYEAMIKNQIEEQTKDLSAMEIANRANEFSRRLAIAQTTGAWTADDIAVLGIRPLANGTYPTPYSGEIAYQKALWEQVEKQKAIDTYYINLFGAVPD